MRAWLHRRRWNSCSICGVEFRKHKVTLPSLVGFAYCSVSCETEAWARWIKG